MWRNGCAIEEGWEEIRPRSISFPKKEKNNDHASSRTSPNIFCSKILCDHKAEKQIISMKIKIKIKIEV